MADVEGLGGEEEVEDELHAVGYGEDPVDPCPGSGVVCYKTQNEGS